MNNQLHQNILFSFLIAFMGLVVNVFHTVADRMALSLGQQAAAAGLFISVFALGSLASVVLSSGLADRVGKRRVIAAGLVVMAGGFLLIYFSSTFVPLIAGLFLFGFGFAPAEGMGSAVLGDENPAQASRWMNISQAGFGLGAIIGPLLAVAWLSFNPSWRSLFLMLSLLSLAFLAWVLYCGRGRMAPVQGAKKQPLNMFQLLKEKRFVVLAVMMFLYLGYESVAPAYIKQLFQQSGETEAMAALMISLFWGAMILGRLLGALFAGREIKSIKGYTVFAFVGILVLVLAQTTWLRVLGVALYGFGCGPVWPMLVTLAARMFPHRSGAAVGMMMLSSMAGITLFPFLIGTLPGNPVITFVFCAILAALVLAVSTRAGKAENRSAR
jgi:FHS family glucose/mannose:H+ symporter-like MFS transporter